MQRRTQFINPLIKTSSSIASGGCCSSFLRFQSSSSSTEQTQSTTANVNAEDIPVAPAPKMRHDWWTLPIKQWTRKRQIVTGSILGATLLFITMAVLDEGEDGEMMHQQFNQYFNIPDDERTPRMKAQDAKREEFYSKGMLSDACVGEGPSIVPLHVCRKFLAFDFPEVFNSDDKLHFEKLLYLYVRHVPQFLSFIRNKTVASGKQVNDGGLRREALKDFLGLDDNGSFNIENVKKNNKNPERAIEAYRRLSNLIPFAINKETGQLENIPDKSGNVVGELRLPVHGNFLKKYLPNLQTWESFVAKYPEWRKSAETTVPVLSYTGDYIGSLYQRAIDLTVPKEFEDSLHIQNHTLKANNEARGVGVDINQHGTACTLNPVLTLAHYGTLKANEEKQGMRFIPMSCWCLDAWDVVRGDLSTPCLTTLLFNSGNLSSIRLIEELFGFSNAEKHLVWNSRFSDGTDNHSLLPYLERYNAGLVPSFRLTNHFIEETKKGVCSFEWDDKTKKAEQEELSKPCDPKKSKHAMILLGERKDRASDKTFYLLQNWWEKSQFVQVEREYLLQHVQDNNRYKQNKQFVCFVPRTAFVGRAKNDFLRMDCSPQVTRQVVMEFGDAEMSEKFV